MHPTTPEPIRDANCLGCDYNLRGLPSGTCPECGRPFTWDDPTTYYEKHHPRRNTYTRSMSRTNTALILAPLTLPLLVAAAHFLGSRLGPALILSLFCFCAGSPGVAIGSLATLPFTSAYHNTTRRQLLTRVALLLAAWSVTILALGLLAGL